MVLMRDDRIGGFRFRQAFHLDADAFGKDEDAVGHPEAFGFRDVAFDRFVVGFIAQRESAIVHRDEDAGLHLDERAHGLLGEVSPDSLEF